MRRRVTRRNSAAGSPTARLDLSSGASRRIKIDESMYVTPLATTPQSLAQAIDSRIAGAGEHLGCRGVAGLAGQAGPIQEISRNNCRLGHTCDDSRPMQVTGFAQPLRPATTHLRTPRRTPTRNACCTQPASRCPAARPACCLASCARASRDSALAIALAMVARTTMRTMTSPSSLLCLDFRRGGA